MSYITIRDVPWSINKEVKEFATLDELTAEIIERGAKDTIIAQRVDCRLTIGPYVAAEEKPELEPDPPPPPAIDYRPAASSAWLGEAEPQEDVLVCVEI